MGNKHSSASFLICWDVGRAPFIGFEMLSRDSQMVAAPQMNCLIQRYPLENDHHILLCTQHSQGFPMAGFLSRIGNRICLTSGPP